jgi:putative hemolysin
MELLVILLLISFNAVFSMAELAVVSSRRYILERSKKEGISGAEPALSLVDNPNKFLSTNQIGITLINISLGAIGGDKFAGQIQLFFERNQIFTNIATQVSILIVVVSITAVTIVFGELIPKRLGLSFPEKIAMKLAGPLMIFSKVASPFVWLLSNVNSFFLKLLGVHEKQAPAITQEELRYMVQQSASSGEIDFVEGDIVERVFDFGDRNIGNLMTTREKLTFFDVEMKVSEVREIVKKDKHAAYPLVKDRNIDQVVGLVLIKDLFTLGDDKESTLLAAARKPLFLNKNVMSHQVLDIFKSQKTHYAIVKDDDNSTLGILTMDDIMNSIVGETLEFDRAKYTIVKRNEFSWLVDARYPSGEFFKYFELSKQFHEQLGFNTVGGFMEDMMGRVPELADQLTVGNIILEVVDKDGPIVDKIMVTKKG